jgi:hypothetical protein
METFQIIEGPKDFFPIMEVDLVGMGTIQVVASRALNCIAIITIMSNMRTQMETTIPWGWRSQLRKGDDLIVNGIRSRRGRRWGRNQEMTMHIIFELFSVQWGKAWREERASKERRFGVRVVVV